MGRKAKSKNLEVKAWLLEQADYSSKARLIADINAVGWKKLSEEEIRDARRAPLSTAALKCSDHKRRY